jgi:hypothetical protein
LNTVSFDVTVTDNVALATVAFTAFFAQPSVQRGQSLQVGGTMAPVQATFTFVIPDNAGFEDVPVVVTALDSSANIATSSVFLLRTTGFTTVGGRTASIAFQTNNGITLGDATDVVAMPTPGEFVVLDPAKLVKVNGAGVASIYSGYTSGGSYLTRATNGDLFISRPGGNVVNRIGAGVGNPFTQWMNATAYTGISMMPARQGRAVINQSQLSGGETLTVGSTVLTKGTSFTDDATLSAALASHPDVTASAPRVGATECGTAVNCVLLTAKVAGAVIPLSTNGNTANVIAGSLNGSQSFWVANNNTAAERYPINLTPTVTSGAAAFLNTVTASGSAAFGGVAARELSPSGVSDFVVYASHSTGTAIRATRSLQVGFSPATNPAAIFNVTGVTGGAAFASNAIFDVAYDPLTGCVVASNQVADQLVLIDTRDVFNSQPQVSVIAQFIRAPRGVSFDDQGNLYVLESGRARVVKIAPSADPTDCF